jgi:hypothetical protein
MRTGRRCDPAQAVAVFERFAPVEAAEVVEVIEATVLGLFADGEAPESQPKVSQHDVERFGLRGDCGLPARGVDAGCCHGLLAIDGRSAS